MGIGLGRRKRSSSSKDNTKKEKKEGEENEKVMKKEEEEVVEEMKKEEEEEVKNRPACVSADPPVRRGPRDTQQSTFLHSVSSKTRLRLIPKFTL